MRLIQVEEIEQLLLQVPRIVDLQETQPTAFVARATIWIDLLEQALVAARARQAMRVAALKSELAFARSAAEPRMQRTRAKQLASEARNAMTEAAGVASAVLDEHRPRFAEADRRIRGLVAELRSNSMVPRSSVGPSANLLGQARRAIASRRELEREYLSVEGTVGTDDASLLLGRALIPHESAGVAHRRQEGTNHSGQRR